jgi:SAM-dependent methyltransferase
VLNPDFPIDEVKISLCGEAHAAQGVVPRPDVGKVFHTIRHARRSGFSADLPVGVCAGREVVRVDIEGRQAGRLVGKYFGVQLVAKLPRVFPPGHLMKRVAGTTMQAEFSQIGLQVAFDLMNAAEKHRPGITTRVRTRLLDYGCGCGRVAPFLMHFWPSLELSGCDIDAEAIAWDNANLKAGAFRAMTTAGPLPYGGQEFDLIVGVSVMTHLTRAEQHRWLAELARAQKPGGLCLLSTHGVPVCRYNPGLGSMLPRMRAEGIVDRLADGALEGVAPPGYYRSTLQSPEFTRKEWSAYFRVVEVLEGGLDGYQDLVVLEKKD